MQVGIYVCMSVCLSVCLSVCMEGGYHGGEEVASGLDHIHIYIYKIYIYIYTYMHIHISICLCSLTVQACLHPSWHSTSQRATPKASCLGSPSAFQANDLGICQANIGSGSVQASESHSGAELWCLSMLCPQLSHPKLR